MDMEATKEEKQQMDKFLEEDLAESEASEFAALRSRTEDLDAAVRIPVKPKTNAKPAPKLAPPVKVTPRLSRINIKVTPKGQSSSLALSSKGGEPASKRTKSAGESAEADKKVEGSHGSDQKFPEAEKDLGEDGEGAGLAGLLGYSASSDEDE
eukprot:gene21529-28519_t